MVTNRISDKGNKIKRITVSLEEDDYYRLVSLVEGRRPRLTLRYAIEYAVKDLLKRAENPQSVLDFGAVISAKDTDGQT